jgi:hypothetical protein
MCVACRVSCVGRCVDDVLLFATEQGGALEKCIVLWLEAMTEYYRLLTRKHYFSHLMSVRTVAPPRLPLTRLIESRNLQGGMATAFPHTGSACVFEIYHLVRHRRLSFSARRVIKAPTHTQEGSTLINRVANGPDDGIAALAAGEVSSVDHGVVRAHTCRGVQAAHRHALPAEPDLPSARRVLSFVHLPSLLSHGARAQTHTHTHTHDT